MALTREEVRHVADLARLQLTEEEVGQFVQELGRILEYVAQLQELDLSDVPPTTHVVEMRCRLRPDEPAATLSRDAALANAPDADEGQFRVPRIIGHGDV